MKLLHLEIPRDRPATLRFDSRSLQIKVDTRGGELGGSMQPGLRVLRVAIQFRGWLIEDRFFRPGSEVTIGSTRSATFRLPTQGPALGKPLLEYRNDRSISLSVSREFSGVLERDGSLEELRPIEGGETFTHELPRSSKGALEFGNLVLFFEEIPDPGPGIQTRRLKQLFDPKFFKWMIVSTFLHFLFLLVIKILPPPIQEIEGLVFSTGRSSPPITRVARIDVYPRKYALEPPSDGKGGTGVGVPSAGGEEGRSGPGRPNPFGEGVLGILSDSPNWAGLLTTPKIGEADRHLRFHPHGREDGRGPRYGVGRDGTGTGGGNPHPSVTVGDLPISKPLGKGPGSGPTFRPVGNVHPPSTEEVIFLSGTLSKETVAKIIGDHMGQIRWCYEKELQLHPELRGKITTQFVIGLEGKVTEAKIRRSTLGNAKVEECLIGVVKKLPFPKPGAGVVEVVYPFLFRVAG